MASITEQNKETLLKAGVNIESVENPLVLSNMVKQLERGAKVVDGAIVKASAGSSSASANKGSDISGGSIVLWLKSTAYINDRQRLQRGVYMVDEVPPRLLKLGSDTVEWFKDEVPPRKLVAIANWCGIKHPEEKTDEEILSIVCTKLNIL